jgi:hypothetical protein
MPGDQHRHPAGRGFFSGCKSSIRDDERGPSQRDGAAPVSLWRPALWDLPYTPVGLAKTQPVAWRKAMTAWLRKVRSKESSFSPSCTVPATAWSA